MAIVRRRVLALGRRPDCAAKVTKVSDAYTASHKVGVFFLAPRVVPAAACARMSVTARLPLADGWSTVRPDAAWRARREPGAWPALHRSLARRMAHTAPAALPQRRASVPQSSQAGSSACSAYSSLW